MPSSAPGGFDTIGCGPGYANPRRLRASSDVEDRREAPDPPPDLPLPSDPPPNAGNISGSKRRADARSGLTTISGGRNAW